MLTLIQGTRVVTLQGAAPRRGEGGFDLGARDDTDVLLEGDCIRAVGRGLAAGLVEPHRTVAARGRVLMPAFVDAHTHACFAGSRLDEWERKLAGVPYLDLLKQGGGILSTVRAVRAASQQELAESLAERLACMARLGTGTVEVKSGYGLTTEQELKMLRAIDDAARAFPGTVVKTALLGHAVDPGQKEFARRIIDETLPAVHAEFPGIAIDCFVEEGALQRDEAVELLHKARALGHPVRVHADQFTERGMTAWAAGAGTLSVDHLEASSPDGLRRLARSGTFGVLLPGTGFHLDGRYADGRAFVDAGGAAVVATNFNPGSSPTCSMPLVIALAVRANRLTVQEAIAAATVNAARLLGFGDRGTIEPGMRADLVLLDHKDERELAFEFGGNPAARVFLGGVEIARP